MNDNQTLELQLKTTGEEALKVLQKLTSEITGLSTGVKDISKNIKNINGINTDINKIEKSTNKASVSVGKLNKAFGSLFGIMAVKRVGLKAMEFLDDATNRAEELNLFNVIFKNIEKDGEKTFSELGKSAMRFQNQLNEAFGTNMTETLRYQGLFQAMATNQGLTENYAAIMSENMVKLTYDLASLYNRTEKSTAEALRAGVYAGQTKPLRGFGIDVTQTSLNPTLQSLGITDRTVNQMSQAEKQILRYITALRQAQSAMGDFANTVESPANQLKILRQQLIEVKAAWGNLFMGLYSEVLPYANAILMVLKEIAKALANIFGIEVQDYNTGLASTEEIYEGIADGAGNAAKAVKELNRQALSFDQLHNLQTPSKSAGSGVGGLSGGIDQRLLDAIGGYDNLMEKVKMKATDIRDRIMEWLGFTKEINLLTGETSFKFDHITGGTVLGALAVGGTIYVGIKKIHEMVNSIFGKAGKGTEGVANIAGAAGKGAAGGAAAKTTGGLLAAIGYTDLAAIGGSLALIGAEMYDVSEKTKEFNTFDYKKTGLAQGIEDFNTAMGILSMNPISAIFNFNTINDMLAQMQDGMNNVITAGAIFDATISDISQRKLTDLINEFQTLDGIVQTISFSNKLVSEDDITAIKNLMKMIKDTIVNELDADKNEELKNLKVLEKALGIEDYEKIKKEIEKYYDGQVQTVAEKEQQINDIIATANEEKRSLTAEDLEKINQLRSEMLETGISSMTESEEEFKKIMIRLNHNVEALTLERASFIIKNAKETKEKAIKEAEDQYTNILLQAEKMKDAGVITEDGYNKMVEAATKAREDSIKETNTQYDEILRTIKEKMGKNSEYLDLETGNVKKKMETWNFDLGQGLNNGIDSFTYGIQNALGSLWGTLTGWTGVSDFKADTEKQMGDLKTNLEGWKANLKKPKISWQADGIKATGTIKTILETLGLPTSLPKLSVQWVSAYANGGFPEDGLFFANHSELVGKFSNGKTAVANNEQIIQGIQQGVYTGVMSAMSQSRMNTGNQVIDIEFYAHTDEGVIIDRINQKTKQTGKCPINIPVENINVPQMPVMGVAALR